MKKSRHEDMNLTTEKLPADVIKAFENLGDLQRGLPEMAMLQIQFANGGGVLNPLVEHLGDIIHRMTYLVSRDTVYNKAQWLARD